jgi:SAM-dependent methyltransferase
MTPFDDWQPLPARASQRQIVGVIDELPAPPARVIDLGCGDGRVLLPLALHGHTMIGLDRDPAAIAQCREGCAGLINQPRLRRVDFLRGRAPFAAPPAHAALCLGNALMTVTGSRSMTSLFARVSRSLRRKGLFLIDDFPFHAWREIAEGRWRDGRSRDGTRLAFTPGEAIVTITPPPHARGRRAARSARAPGRAPAAVTLRLWSMSDLDAVAEDGGFRPGERREEPGLIVFRRV